MNKAITDKIISLMVSQIDYASELKLIIAIKLKTLLIKYWNDIFIHLMNQLSIKYIYQDIFIHSM